MGACKRRRWLVAGISTAVLVAAVVASPAASQADTYPPPRSLSADAGQPFASSVIAEYHNLARRADPLAALKTVGPDATDCKHQEGITRKDADGRYAVHVHQPIRQGPRRGVLRRRRARHHLRPADGIT